MGAMDALLSDEVERHDANKLKRRLKQADFKDPREKPHRTTGPESCTSKRRSATWPAEQVTKCSMWRATSC